MKQPFHKPIHELKYIQDLSDDFAAYINTLIFNVYHGVAKSMGVKNPNKLAATPPWQVEKGFLDGIKNIGGKLRGFIGRRFKSPLTPFTLKRKLYKYRDGKAVEAMTPKEWQKFEQEVSDYLQPYLQHVAEEFPVKAVLAGMASAEMESQGKISKQYGKKSFDQIEKEKFDGFMPDTVEAMDERYRLGGDPRKAMSQAYVRIADHVQNVDNDVRSAIKRVVQNGHQHNMTPMEVASDLYWMKDEAPELKNHTAHSLMRDWHRVAFTELAMIHENSKAAAHEEQARESIENPEKAVYKVFTGRARCEVCQGMLGAIVRQVPAEMVKDPSNDSLKSMGVNDPHTDIAFWVGKSNIGFKKAQWRVTAVVHPWCDDTLQVINPETQEFDKDTRTIKHIPNVPVEKYVPEDFLKKIETLQAENRLRRQQKEADRMAGIHKRDADYYEGWRDGERPS